MMLSSVKPGSVLPLYSFSFCRSVRFACFGGFSLVSTAHIAAISIVCGAICLPPFFSGVEVLFVNLDLIAERVT